MAKYLEMSPRHALHQVQLPELSETEAGDRHLQVAIPFRRWQSYLPPIFHDWVEENGYFGCVGNP
jgi:RecB family exonuclease